LCPQSENTFSFSVVQFVRDFRSYATS
jgi:hypothetical protein